MTDHTDPIRLVLSLEQLRDPIIKAMGMQLSLKDREIALANREIAELQKRLGAPVSVPPPAPAAPTPKAQRPPIRTTDNDPATWPSREQPKPITREHWLLALLREHGPLQVAKIASLRRCALPSVYCVISLHRGSIEDDGKRPATYRLKQATAEAKS